MIGYDDMMHYQSVAEARGRQEGREESKVEMIRNMKAEHIDVNAIARIVAMSVSEVEAILNKFVQA